MPLFILNSSFAPALWALPSRSYTDCPVFNPISNQIYLYLYTHSDIFYRSSYFLLFLLLLTLPFFLFLPVFLWWWFSSLNIFFDNELHCGYFTRVSDQCLPILTLVSLVSSHVRHIFAFLLPSLPAFAPPSLHLLATILTTSSLLQHPCKVL